MSGKADLLALLATPGTTLTKTMSAVDALEKDCEASNRVSLGISSNVSMDLVSLYLRKYALLAGTSVRVRIGNHDDPLADVELFGREGIEEMLYLPFFDNLMPAFERRIELLSDADLAAIEADLRARICLVFDKARGMRRVYLGSFHRFSSPVDTGEPPPPMLCRPGTAWTRTAPAFRDVTADWGLAETGATDPPSAARTDERCVGQQARTRLTRTLPQRMC